MRRVWLDGDPCPDVLSLFGNISGGYSAKRFEHLAAEALICAGFGVMRQWRVRDRGDGYGGYVDMVASCRFRVIAIELDRITPRKKSIFKVQQVEGATTRLVYCRLHNYERTR